MRNNPLTSHINAGIPATSFIKTKAPIKSFTDAFNFLSGEKEKKVASNVVVHKLKNSKSIAIKLYGTDIIIYHSNGTFEADNGGFNTPTTSTRCNQFGPKDWTFFHHKKKLRGYFDGRDYKTGLGTILPTGRK